MQKLIGCAYSHRAVGDVEAEADIANPTFQGGIAFCRRTLTFVVAKRAMPTIDEKLDAWKASLFASIPVAGLLARNEVAYKWKAPFRSLMLREAVCWRTHDLLAQSYLLHQQGHGLGARILLRSAFETVAILIHLNQLVQKVLDEKLDFHIFAQKTSALLLGSRNGDDGPRAINVVTVLEKCDQRYPGMLKLYADLSESAHPNYEGLCSGYSKVNHNEYETNFSNRWMELHGDKHIDQLDLCMILFYHEYNDIWGEAVEKLEKWIVVNDDKLEATKQP
jgi:hypothetical protein